MAQRHLRYPSTQLNAPAIAICGLFCGDKSGFYHARQQLPKSDSGANFAGRVGDFYAIKRLSTLLSTERRFPFSIISLPLLFHTFKGLGGFVFVLHANQIDAR